MPHHKNLTVSVSGVDVGVGWTFDLKYWDLGRLGLRGQEQLQYSGCCVAAMFVVERL